MTPASGYRILIADAEPALFSVYRAALGAEPAQNAEQGVAAAEQSDAPALGSGPFAITFCRPGAETVEAVRRASLEQQPFAVAFARMLPDAEGIEALAALRALDPLLNIVIIAGLDADAPAAIRTCVAPPDKLLVLRKPLYPTEIQQLACTLAAKWELERAARYAQNRLDTQIAAPQLAEQNLALGREIAERRRTEAALRISEQRYRILYDDNPAMFFTLDSEGTVLSINRFGAAQLGYHPQELLGTALTLLCRQEDQARTRQHLTDCLEQPVTLHRWRTALVHRDGSLLWVRKTARRITDSDGRLAILIVCEDISEAHQLFHRLAYQNRHDSLTGLLNRQAFEQRLQQLLETAPSQEAEHVLCYLDLDQFKVINDTCGHDAGDELLRQVGQLLQGSTRKSDAVARLGGDEFGILLEQCPLVAAERVVSALHQRLESYRFYWNQQNFAVGASVGLVPISAAGSVSEVLRLADTVCYAAKDQGRHRIYIYRQNDTELGRHHGEMQWVARIERALDEGRFKLSVQSIIALSGERQGEHYEVLLRMIDEQGNLIMPGAFLPAAERYGLSTRLDRWVIEHTLAWLIAHPQDLDNLFLCSINLSGHSIGQQELLQFITQKFAETQVPAQKICFEVTEHAAVANFANAIVFIKALRALGCRFALDDFGRGLCSFAYLKTLPVDFLKIDGLFVKDSLNDPIALAMVKSIHDIGHVMGIKTIAEFVENQPILDQLKHLGVDYGQGYHIGRPQLLP